MKKSFLLKTMLLLFALIVGVSGSWAETSTVTASKIASSSASWTGSANETWAVSVTGGATNQNVTNSYAQIGTKSSPSTSVTFSTSGISGTITKIVVDCASYSGLATLSATVGGNAFGTQNQNSPSWSSNSGGNVTFEGSATGAIVITMSNGNGGRAMYIKSITVTYSGSATPVCATPTFSPAAGVVVSGTQVSIETTTQGATIYYTMGSDPEDPTISSTKYESPITITEATTIKAIAVKSGLDNSEVASVSYTIFSIKDGVFDFEKAGDVVPIVDYGSGVSPTTDGTSYVTEAKTWVAENVTLVTDGKYRWWNGDKTLRFYKNTPASSATFYVPNGYVITKIETAGGNFSTADEGKLEANTWTGVAQSVKLSTGDTGVNFKSFTVTYSAVPENVTATIASSGYTTYCSPYDLSFEGVENLEAAYVVTTSTSSSAKLTKVTAAPAGTGVILKGTTGAVSIPVAEYTGETISNILVGTLEATPVTAETVYVVSDGKFKLFAGTEIPANKAYLPVSAISSDGNAPALSIEFDDETTGINSVERGALSVEGCYTLDGRRVAQPTKGLYIVNGRKVIIK